MSLIARGDSSSRRETPDEAGTGLRYGTPRAGSATTLPCGFSCLTGGLGLSVTAQTRKAGLGPAFLESLLVMKSATYDMKGILLFFDFVNES